MIGRLSYVLRETFASFRRNMTLTVAAIISTSVQLAAPQATAPVDGPAGKEKLS